jgi:lipopolysaccharide/colanic/teichoic acid biosynthesis glycosyltransferase
MSSATAAFANSFFPAASQAGSALPRYKRCLDLVIASLAILALSPLFLAAALAVKLSSAGPVFFFQTRVGFGGRHFRMIKFRSMFIDAEARRAALLADSERQGVCFKMKNDPRVTPVGRFIRRFSIDELPQLFNVLLGDMSLVGPRPGLPQEVAAYPARAMQRLNAVPGITGLWQVSGRAEVPFEEMVEMDIRYIQGMSLATDLRILAATFGAVVSARGSY